MRGRGGEDRGRGVTVSDCSHPQGWYSFCSVVLVN